MMELLQMFCSTWFILFTGLLFLIFIYLNKYFQYWEKHGIPTPTNSFWSYLRGQYEFLKLPMHLLQMENYKKYGRVYGIFFGIKPQLVVSDPHILKNILIKDFNMFHNRMKFKVGNPLFDNMLVVSEGEDWKRIRCIISPAFTSSRMRKMAYLVRECAEKLTEHVKKMNMADGIDCKKFLGPFAIDIVASTAFGTKLCSLEDPDNEFNKATKATHADSTLRLAFYFMFPKLMRTLKIEVFPGSFDLLKDFTLHAIKRREEEKTKATDFLQLLVDARNGVLEISAEDAKEINETEFKMLPKHKTMSSDEMLAQCIIFLFAGTETTTNTLAFILYFMALNPELQDKLTQEIDEVWKNNDEINFDVLAKMKYLEAVINETLRMQPIGVHLMRECTEDYEIPEISFKIPKGMNVAVPIHAIHQDKEYYPNPEKFDPERFMPENRHSIPAFAYLPFGEGPRHCIGMRFALMVVKMCVVHIFRDFRVLATEETKKPLEFFNGQGLVQPKNVMVGLERRK